MNNFIYLLFREIMIQNKIYSIIRYNIQFLLLGSIALVFVQGASSELAEFGINFIIVGLPLSIISIARPIMKADIADGTMELMMITLSTSKIIFIKFLSFLIINLAAFAVSMPIIALFYPVSLQQLFLVSLGGALLLGQISALSLLTSCVEGYFRTNTNLIAFVILPLIIPGLIACGLLTHNNEQWPMFIGVLAGIDLVIIPISILLAEYLARNIYNT